MRFLSLFSGIEAATCAWHPLGWECAAVAEVEPFPCSLLKYHYPQVPNLGDVTKITADQINALGNIDLVCGGFPCQDLSVAGKRKGLSNADGTSTRSGLFFDAMRIADWANPRWLFIENVPGMFSSNAGRDFASVVGEMAGCEFAVPRDGWRNAGVVVGPRGLVEWSVMDAQYHGVAQRRRRVFVVGCLGDWRSAAAVLFERHSLQGHPAPRRQAGQAVTGTLSARTEGGGGLGTDFELGGGLRAVPTLVNNGDAHSGFRDEHGLVATLCVATGQAGAEIGAEMAPTLNCNHEAPYVVAGVTPFDTTQITSAANYSNPKAGDPCHPLAAQAHVPAIAVALRGRDGGATAELGDEVGNALRASSGGGDKAHVLASMAVRRLTPVECERLQGFPDNYTAVPNRGKPAADGPRYKALGNSWAVPNVRWIGQRIDMVSTINTLRKAA